MLFLYCVFLSVSINTYKTKKREGSGNFKIALTFESCFFCKHVTNFLVF